MRLYETCRNCDFFVEDVVTGDCRRHAPVRKNDRRDSPNRIFPDVRPDDYCGDWRAIRHVDDRGVETSASRYDSAPVNLPLAAEPQPPMKTELTQEEKRNLIAKACKWTDIKLYEDNAGPSFWSGMPPANFVETFRKEKTHGAKLPNYFGDLNACAEMRKALVTPLLRSSFEFYLAKLVAEKWGLNQLCGEEPSPFKMIDAPAGLQAAAFGQALDLW